MDKAEIYETLNEAYFSATPHEQEVIDHLPLLVSGAGLCLDCGASLGQYTRAMSRTMHAGTILSIEADPIRFEELARNADRWQRETGNVIEPRHFALREASGETPYFVTNSNISGGLTKHEVAPDVDWEEVQIPGTSLDDLLDGRIPDFVKIDVEGAEMSVLRGAPRTLAQVQTTWLIELHGWGEDSPTTAVAQLMRDHGYRHVDFFGQDVFVADRVLWRRLLALELTDAGRARRRVKRGVKRLLRRP